MRKILLSLALLAGLATGCSKHEPKQGVFTITNIPSTVYLVHTNSPEWKRAHTNTASVGQSNCVDLLDTNVPLFHAEGDLIDYETAVHAYPVTVVFGYSPLSIECETNYTPTNILADGYTGTITIGTNQLTVEQIEELINTQ